jgi:hypothetical protein
VSRDALADQAVQACREAHAIATDALQNTAVADAAMLRQQERALREVQDVLGDVVIASIAIEVPA